MSFQKNKEWENCREILKSIHDQLQQIATRTGEMALVGSANKDNPIFCDLMEKHVALLKRDNELISKMEELLSNGNL